MTTIDTTQEKRYSPLIPAVKAICEAKPGQSLQIVTDNEAIFRDLKEFLAERKVGFREIYDGERMVLEFRIK